MFWGVTLKPGNRYSQVVDASFHMTMAALEPPTAAESGNKYVSVMVEHEKTEHLLATLGSNNVLQVPLDLLFAEGEAVSFFVKGEGTVHLTGYVMPEDDFDEIQSDMDESDESEMDELNEKQLQAMIAQKRKNQIADVGGKKAKIEQKIDPLEKFAKNAVQNKQGKNKQNNVADGAKKQNSIADGKKNIEFNNKKQDDSDDDDDDDDSDSDDFDMTQELFADEMDSDSEEEADLKKEVKQFKQKLVAESPKSIMKSDKKKKGQSPQKQNQNQLNKSPQKQKQPQMDGQKQIAGKPNQNKTPNQNQGKNENNVKIAKKTLAKGVVIEDTMVGSGPLAKPGKFLHVSYVGRLANSKKEFDKQSKFGFRLGKGEVIKGLEIGMTGMQVGGKRRITIPAHAGYGNKPTGPIPANSNLLFEIELKAIS